MDGWKERSMRALNSNGKKYNKDLYIFKSIKNIYIDPELVLPMYNEHPYFSFKYLGKKVHIIHGKIW